MKQAVDVFETYITSVIKDPTPMVLEPAQFGELFICNQSMPGLNLIEELKGRRIMKVTGGVAHTYVFEESSDIENTITALHTGEDDRIQFEDRITGTIEDAIACLEGTKIVDISTGKSFVMLLTQEGEVYSYGAGQHGILGHGGSFFEEKPRMIRKLQNRVINQISCGAYHTLALSNYGDVYAWGKGFEGQLGIRKGLECCSSPQLLVKFYKYDDGQIGYMKKTAIKQIACGTNHSMAIDENGNLYSWGQARFGQTGNGRKVKQQLPTLVVLKKDQQTKRAKSVKGGFGHTLCLTQDGLLYSWGLNTKGQLGINDISENTKIRSFDTQLVHVKAVHHPVLLLTDSSKTQLPKFTSIACGFNSSFATDQNGSAWAWGGDVNGFKDQKHCERAPRIIIQNTEDRKFNRVFANENTLVFFSPVRVLSFNPILGPSKGSTQLTLFATGLIDTGLQKVKFSIGQQYMIVDAQFDPSSLTYFCKTPDFQQICKSFPTKCQISISLDGIQFQPYKQQFLLYSSTLTAQSIEPKSASTKGQQKLVLSIQLPEVICQYIPSITVGFRHYNKDKQQKQQKPSWTCVEGIYSQRQIKCTIPKINKFDSNLPYYHVDISINGQQFSGLPNTIRLYEVSNIDINPKEGYEQGNYPISITGDGLFDSTRKKIQLKVVCSEIKEDQFQFGRQIQVINWDKIEKKYVFDMPPLTWLLGGKQATPQIISQIKSGVIEVSLTLSGVQWIPMGNFKFIDPPPPPPEPQQTKDTKKGAKKATKK